MEPGLSSTYPKEIRVTPNDTPVWNVVTNSGLGKFRRSASFIATSYQLSSKNVDCDSVTNSTVVGPNWLTTLATVDGQFITLTG